MTPATVAEPFGFPNTVLANPVISNNLLIMTTPKQPGWTFKLVAPQVEDRMRKQGISTVQQLSRVSHVGRTTLQAVLNSKQDPTDNIVRKLASALKCHPGEISTWSWAGR